MIDLVYYDSESMMDVLTEKFEEGTLDPDTGEKISVTDADYDADISQRGAAALEEYIAKLKENKKSSEE